MIPWFAPVGSAVVAIAWRASRRAPARDRALALRVTGAAGPSRIDKLITPALERAALPIDVRAARRLWIAAVSAAFLLFAPTDVRAGIGAGVLVGGSGPLVLLLMRDRAARRATLALPRVVESLASELRAGGTVHSAISRLAGSRVALAGELARFHERLELGATFGDAARRWARESHAAGAGAVAGALTMAVTAGGPAADALDELAGSLDDRVAVVAEARALAAQARVSAYVVGVAPLAYLAYAAVADRALIADLVGSAFGRLCLCVGILLDALGALCIRWLLREEPMW